MSMEIGWGILELMGHVRVAGQISEEERFGVKLGRIDIPTKDGTIVTQFFSGSSIYRVTPTSEEVAAARDIALSFGVPPQMLGIPGDNHYANYQEAKLAFWNFVDARKMTVKCFTKELLGPEWCRGRAPNGV